MCALQGHKIVAGGNAPGMVPTGSDPERVEPGWRHASLAACGPGSYDPFRVGGTSVALSGGVAPGYSIDPLRGSEHGAIFVKMGRYRGPGSVVRALTARTL